MKFSKSIFKSFLSGAFKIFDWLIIKPRSCFEYNPMKKCANRMKEAGERFSKVLKKYEERNG